MELAGWSDLFHDESFYVFLNQFDMFPENYDLHRQ